jgi:putative serine protease PepD
MDSPSQSRPRGSRLLRWVVFGVTIAAVSAIAAACSSGTGTTGTASRASGVASTQEAQYEKVVKNVLPSVVQIRAGDSTGSGVVYDSKGDIVTNAHVIGSATTATVREPVDDKQVDATVIGKFMPDDLAVIRVNSDASGLKPAAWANSSDAQVGQIVLAMGNPLGLTDSVTQGIVSATGRTVGEGSGSSGSGSGQALITSAIQTSAAINPGNSGGALVDLSDQVLGIPTLAARLPDEGGAAPGIGFAIPSNTVRNIAGQLIKDGKVTNSGRASLGITAETAVNSAGDPIGVGIVATTTGGTAASAGLHDGDIIVGINNTKTPTVDALQSVLAGLKPGSKVTIHYLPGGTGAEKTGSAKLGSLTG